MDFWERWYERLVGTASGDSIGGSMRRRRWAVFGDWFPSIEAMRVLDLGGTVESWSLSPFQPAHVTLVNPAPGRADSPHWVDQVVADACNLPSEIRRETWDLVYSNSVLEHVGGHSRRLEFAQGVLELAPEHWVQTPYRYFPIEPHWVFPGFQFLPVSWRTSVSTHWPLNRWRSPDRQKELRRVLGVELLSKTEFASYFPASTIIREPFLGLTKSMIAVRSSVSPTGLPV